MAPDVSNGPQRSSSGMAASSDIALRPEAQVTVDVYAGNVVVLHLGLDANQTRTVAAGTSLVKATQLFTPPKDGMLYVDMTGAANRGDDQRMALVGLFQRSRDANTEIVLVNPPDDIVRFYEISFRHHDSTLTLLHSPHELSVRLKGERVVVDSEALTNSLRAKIEESNRPEENSFNSRATYSFRSANADSISFSSIEVDGQPPLLRVDVQGSTFNGLIRGDSAAELISRHGSEGDVLVDISRIELLTDEGIGNLITLYRQLKSEGKSLSVLANSDAIEKMERMKLHKLLSLRDASQEA